MTWVVFLTGDDVAIVDAQAGALKLWTGLGSGTGGAFLDSFVFHETVGF